VNGSTKTGGGDVGATLKQHPEYAAYGAVVVAAGWFVLRKKQSSNAPRVMYLGQGAAGTLDTTSTDLASWSDDLQRNLLDIMGRPHGPDGNGDHGPRVNDVPANRDPAPQAPGGAAGSTRPTLTPREYVIDIFPESGWLNPQGTQTPSAIVGPIATPVTQPSWTDPEGSVHVQPVGKDWTTVIGDVTPTPAGQYGAPSNVPQDTPVSSWTQNVFKSITSPTNVGQDTPENRAFLDSLNREILQTPNAPDVYTQWYGDPMDWY
jgi:hypothetical protein